MMYSHSGIMQGPDQGPNKGPEIEQEKEPGQGSDKGPDKGLVEGPGQGPDKEPGQEPEGSDEGPDLPYINDNSRIMNPIEQAIPMESTHDDNLNDTPNETFCSIDIQEESNSNTHPNSKSNEIWEFVPKSREKTINSSSDPCLEPSLKEDSSRGNSVEERSSIENSLAEGSSNKVSEIMKKNIKKNKMKKIEKNEKIVKGYELEKELRLCDNNDTALNKLMCTVKLSHNHKMFDDLLEVDVVFNFVIFLQKWCINSNKSNVNTEEFNTVDRLNCNLVFLWFKAISEVASFRIVKLLLSQSQKEKLLIVLLECLDIYSKDISEGELSEKKKNVEDLRSLWQL